MFKRVVARGASGGVGLQGIAGEAVAFDEHDIYFVYRFFAVARRTARPERKSEFGIFRRLAFQPPAGETLGLARQILEGELEGLDPPDESLGIDHAIRRRHWISGGNRRLPQGRHTGIAGEHVDAWGNLGEDPAVRGFKVFAWIEKLKGGT